MNEKIYQSTSSGYTGSNIPALLKPFFISHGQDDTCSTAFIIHVTLKLNVFSQLFRGVTTHHCISHICSQTFRIGQMAHAADRKHFALMIFIMRMVYCSWSGGQVELDLLQLMQLNLPLHADSIIFNNSLFCTLKKVVRLFLCTQENVSKNIPSLV